MASPAPHLPRIEPKPLSATIGERLGIAPPEPVRRPAPRIGPAPSSEPKPQLHALPPPDGPDRSTVDAPPAESTVSKPDATPKRGKLPRRWGKAPYEERARIIDAFRRLVADGKTWKEASKAVHCSETMIRRWLIKGKYQASPETRARVLAAAKPLRAKGKSDREIAARFGIHQTTMSIWLSQEREPPAPSARGKFSAEAIADSIVKARALIAEGKTVKEAAKALGIRDNTLGWRLRNSEAAKASKPPREPRSPRADRTLRSRPTGPTAPRDLGAVTADIQETMAKLRALKSELRAILGDE